MWGHFLPTGGVDGPNALGNNVPARSIDVHHHVVPPVYLREAGDQIAAQVNLTPNVTGWTPDRSLEGMDRMGIAASIVSVSTPRRCQSG